MTGVAAILMTLFAQGEPTGVPLEDLGLYRDALTAPLGAADCPPVSFADLWNAPARFRGRAVTFTGRVVREFHAPASGELPARAEVWLETAGNLVCAVVPETADTARRQGLATVRGISLGTIRYAGGDAIRVAPLIVGPGPLVIRSEPPSPSTGAIWDRTSWMLAGVALFGVVALLIGKSGNRPKPPRPIANSRVEFLS